MAESAAEPGEEETPAYQSWWFWTIIGVGVAAAAGATVGIVAAFRAWEGTAAT